MLGMYRPEVSAQGRRSPSEAMPSPRGSKPCAVRYVHLLYEGRYFSQTSGTGTFCRAGLAARAAYSTRVISLLTVPCYELLEHIRVLPPGRGQRGRLRPPTRASRAKLVCCLLVCAEALGRCSGWCGAGYGGLALNRLNQRSSGPVQSDAGGKSIGVRFPPCSSSNSYSSRDGRSATLHFDGTNS